jgi:sensor histidine kinase regulating citrate/malate metabolism
MRQRLSLHSTTMQPTSPIATEEVDMKVDDALKLLQDRGAQVLNAIDDGVVFLDNTGRTIFINEAAGRMLGFGHALAPRDADGNIVQWFGTNTDIDNQKRVDQVLSEAHAVRGDVAGLGDGEWLGRWWHFDGGLLRRGAG